MSRGPRLAGALLAAIAMLACAQAHSQARGASVWQLEGKGQTIENNVVNGRQYLAELVRENGLDPEELESGRVRMVPGVGWVLEREGGEQIALQVLGQLPEALDESARASKLAEQSAWLRRLIGRFRISGRVETGSVVVLGAGETSIGIPKTVHGDVDGVADCAAVGAGPGVHCLINATWPVIEPIRTGAESFIALMGPPEASERVRLLRPAVMVLGLDPDTAEIRVSMVTDDSVAHIWSGRLETNTLSARRWNNCYLGQGVAGGAPPPCFQPVEIIAEPDSDLVTMVHRAAGVTIQLLLQRDPAARAEKPMKTKKVR